MKKGFTLIELLIVIGILAILATATILVLNPAQLFAQARDSQRIADLASLRSALSLYVSTVTSPDMGFGTPTCGTDWGVSAYPQYAPTKRVAATAAGASNAGVATSTAGIGWVFVDLSSVPSGSPLSALPTDPSNDATYNYQYSCDNTNKTFEINAEMESTRYAGCDGGDDVEGVDGGNASSAGGSCFYEVGTDPGLDL